jgi:putative pyruvate formate lyase activating enzyme
LSVCRDCPRNCGAEREGGAQGRCRSGYLPRAARAAAHFGEEPCISGTRGSGTIFFTGCALGCVYCQNHEISRGGGVELTVPKLRDTMLRLRDTGVHNISLVTGSHFVWPIAEALSGLELGVPVVWNSSGYESVETLRLLEGLVQIYMPDFKYSLPLAAKKYSDAEDYPEVASAAILEMFRQVGVYRMDDEEILRSGVLIRHLILPGQLENSRGVIDWVAEHFPMGGVLFSLMGQYTPMPGVAERFPELGRAVTEGEAGLLYEYLLERGIEDGYWQEPEAAGEDMIPAFDGTGLD